MSLVHDKLKLVAEKTVFPIPLEPGMMSHEGDYIGIYKKLGVYIF